MKELFKSPLLYFGIVNFGAGIFISKTLIDNVTLGRVAVPFGWIFYSIGFLSILVAKEFIRMRKK